MLLGTINASPELLCTELTIMSTNSERLYLKVLQPVLNPWIAEVEFDEDLDGIEEKYATLTSQVPQKRQNTKHSINLCNSNNKCSNNKTTSLNFVDVLLQVQKGTSSVKTAYKGKFSSTNNLASTSQNMSQYIPSCATRVKDEEDTASISDNDLTELVEVRIQEITPEIKE
ncbi:hypothetical protein C2G38_2209716 [Gigaspora rosea]|uniref:Uncharacterized protein n=1 Tax=Gigaspora rosea TaxID=44941 RepID=A0A397UFQ0_9GLOM|nr:hypothetical protein C2G38_2209716 [Gigaspora rosea]